MKKVVINLTDFLSNNEKLISLLFLETLFELNCYDDVILTSKVVSMK